MVCCNSVFTLHRFGDITAFAAYTTGVDSCFGRNLSCDGQTDGEANTGPQHTSRSNQTVHTKAQSAITMRLPESARCETISATVTKTSWNAYEFSEVSAAVRRCGECCACLQSRLIAHLHSIMPNSPCVLRQVKKCMKPLQNLGVTTGAVPAMKSEATAIFAPQDGRRKITVSFDGRRFCVPKFRH